MPQGVLDGGMYIHHMMDGHMYDIWGHAIQCMMDAGMCDGRGHVCRMHTSMMD